VFHHRLEREAGQKQVNAAHPMSGSAARGTSVVPAQDYKCSGRRLVRDFSSRPIINFPFPRRVGSWSFAAMTIASVGYDRLTSTVYVLA
jgi:hypothetical protein